MNVKMERLCTVMNKPIDKTQIKLIHIAKSKLGISDEEYRTMLSDRYWVNTSKELNYEDASDLIDHFKTLGFTIVSSRGHSGGSPVYHKEYEQSIEGLKKEICDIARARWGEFWERSLNKLINNKFQVTHWKFLDVTTGKKIKRMLISMQAAGPYKKASHG